MSIATSVADAEKIQTPCRVKPEEFEISRLEIEQEMVTNAVAGEVRILRRKIVSYGKALDQRSVWPEIAVLRISDLELTPAGIERGEHHPRYKDNVSSYE